MSEWRTAYFCSHCHKEMSSWDATMKDCCPNCGEILPTGRITLNTYKKAFRYVKNPKPWWKRIIYCEPQHIREWKE